MMMMMRSEETLTLQSATLVSHMYVYTQTDTSTLPARPSRTNEVPVASIVIQ